MEPEGSQKKNHDGVAHVELMSQGMISDNYDLIEAAVRASTGDSDETAAIAMLQLKTDQMGAWAVWVPDGEPNSASPTPEPNARLEAAARRYKKAMQDDAGTSFDWTP